MKILEKEIYAYRATVLYIFNPAAIYFTVIYNESYYALFSIAGMYLCHNAKSYYEIIWGSLIFALATCCRSNAIYLLLCSAWAILRIMMNKPTFANLLKGVFTGFTCLACVAITFFTLVVYIGYKVYCIGDTQPEWCNGKFPNVYSYVQAKYWQVGFLRSWIGNERVFGSALWFSIPFNVLGVASIIGLMQNHDWKKVIQYVIYFIALLLTVALVANVEINTRVCASAPIIYWICAQWQIDLETKNKEKITFMNYVKKYMYVVYAVVYFIAEIL